MCTHSRINLNDYFNLQQNVCIVTMTIYNIYIHVLLLLLARYLLFNFPLLSAIVGVSSNFIFLSVIFMLSYLRMLLTVFWGPLRVRMDTYEI